METRHRNVILCVRNVCIINDEMATVMHQLGRTDVGYNAAADPV